MNVCECINSEKRRMNMFICPKTKQPLRIDWQHHEATSAQGDVSYPIVDGILDFVGHDRHVVRESYDHVAGVYDQFLTSPTPLTKLYNALVWGLEDREYVTPLLDGFPEPTGGECIIDIPVGTGAFTVDVYARLCRRATIIVMDYSVGMLQQAKTCYEARGIDNIIYACADVGNLPLVDGCGDVLLTMNGYHAFPEKTRALTELARILKPNGAVLGCFYVKHERWFTDSVYQACVHASGDVYSTISYNCGSQRHLGTIF
jgi:ubiquinone/menaquinone biosynthesis C-methylase UbiE